MCDGTQYCNRDALRCLTDEPPVISLTVPTKVITTPTFEVRGSATDDVGVTGLEWSAGTGEWTPIDLADVAAFSFTVAAPLEDSRTFVVSVRARDRLAESINDSSVVVDRVGPAFQLIAPASATVTNAATVAVTVKATDNSGALTAFTVGGQTVSTPMSGDEETVTLAVPAGLNREPLVVLVSATDKNGNVATQNLDVLIDNVAPLVELTTPAAPDALIATATYTATATVTDPSESTVEFQLGSGTPVPGVRGAAGVWSALLTIPAIEGAEAISVSALDALGNRGTTSRAVRVDRVAPTVTVTSPAANSIHRSDFTVSVTSSADVISLTATMGTAAPVALTQSGSTWSGTITVPAGDFTPRTILFIARDGAGNEGNATLQLNTDTVAPVITVTSPSAAQKFKASDFATSGDVTVTWTIQDGDTSAATTHFDGSPFTGVSRAVTTSATDNPTSYTRAIVAADRAGNTSTVNTTFSVDRVVPTIVTWTPANGTRNLVNATTVITFSEPVFGATSADAPIAITGQTLPTGAWNTNHNEFSVPLSSFIYRVLDVSTLATVADGNGNTIPVQARRLHTATSLGGGTLLSNVTSVSAASDFDGVLSLLVVVSPGCTGTCISNGPARLYRDINGVLTQVGSNFDSDSSSAVLNVWNTVNPSTLESTPAFGGTISRLFGTGSRLVWAGGSQALASGATGAVVSRARVAGETNAPTGGVAVVTGTTYSRAPYSYTLSLAPTGLVSQSNTHASMFVSDGVTPRFSRFWCGGAFPSGNTCGAAEYSVTNSSAITELSAVSTASGSCEIVSFSTATERRYASLTKPAHESGIVFIPSPQSIPSFAVPTTYARSARFGRYTWAGEDTIVYTDYEPGAGGFARVRKMTGCSPNGTDPVVGSISSLLVADNAVPVQVGGRVALLWLTTGAQVRLAHLSP